MSGAETIYDEEIAPLLLAVGKLCQKHGFSMACNVEWEPGETGKTETHPAWGVDGKPSAKQRLVHYAVRCNGNIDAFLIAVLRDAEKHGHSSIYLKQLGCENLVETPSIAAFTIARPNPSLPK